MIGLLCALLKVMSYSFVNIFYANKVGILCLLSCIIATVQVTEDRKHFPQGPHVYQPWCRVWSRDYKDIILLCSQSKHCHHKITQLNFPLAIGFIFILQNLNDLILSWSAY
jgi:hypothetical protein